MRIENKIVDVLAAAECEPVALADKDVWCWQQRWRTVFAKELHAATGKWVLHDYDWHVFRYEHHRSKAGDAAWNEYRRLASCSYVVLSAETRRMFGFSCDGKPPDRLKVASTLSSLQRRWNGRWCSLMKSRCAGPTSRNLELAARASQARSCESTALRHLHLQCFGVECGA